MYLLDHLYEVSSGHIYINGVDISYTQDELVKIGMDIANGKIGDKKIVKWIIEHEM